MWILENPTQVLTRTQQTFIDPAISLGPRKATFLGKRKPLWSKLIKADGLPELSVQNGTNHFDSLMSNLYIRLEFSSVISKEIIYRKVRDTKSKFWGQRTS